MNRQQRLSQALTKAIEGGVLDKVTPCLSVIQNGGDLNDEQCTALKLNFKRLRSKQEKELLFAIFEIIDIELRTIHDMVLLGACPSSLG